MSIFNDQLSLQEKQLSSFTEHLEKGGSLLGVEVKQDSFKFNPKLSFTKKISKCALAILNTLISIISFNRFQWGPQKKVRDLVKQYVSTVKSKSLLERVEKVLRKQPESLKLIRYRISGDELGIRERIKQLDDPSYKVSDEIALEADGGGASHTSEQMASGEGVESGQQLEDAENPTNGQKKICREKLQEMEQKIGEFKEELNKKRPIVANIRIFLEKNVNYLLDEDNELDEDSGVLFCKEVAQNLKKYRPRDLERGLRDVFNHWKKKAMEQGIGYQHFKKQTGQLLSLFQNLKHEQLLQDLVSESEEAVFQKDIEVFRKSIEKVDNVDALMKNFNIFISKFPEIIMRSPNFYLIKQKLAKKIIDNSEIIPDIRIANIKQIFNDGEKDADFLICFYKISPILIKLNISPPDRVKPWLDSMKEIESLLSKIENIENISDLDAQYGNRWESLKKLLVNAINRVNAGKLQPVLVVKDSKNDVDELLKIFKKITQTMKIDVEVKPFESVTDQDEEIARNLQRQLMN